MAGNATDTTIDSVMVKFNGGPFVHVELEYDGVNPEPTITAYLVFSRPGVGTVRERLDTEYNRHVLIDGIREEE